MKAKRIYEQISEGIERIFIIDEKGKKNLPSRGACFAANKYVKRIDGKNQRQKRHFRTFAEAKAFRNGSLVVEERKGGITFSDLIKEWKSHSLPHRAVSTQIRYKSYLQHFHFLDRFEVSRIGALDIDRWISSLKTPEYLARFHTTRCDYGHEFSVLKQILKFYVSRFDRTYRLPFLPEHQKMLRVREKVQVKKDLNLGEFKAFIAALRDVCSKDQKFYYLALLQYAIYGRIQEVAALTVEDFDLGNETIKIDKRIVWPRAKDVKPFVEPGCKVGSGKTVPLNELARNTLREWQMKSGIRNGMLFHNDGEPVSYRQIEHRYNSAFKIAGIKMSGTHVLRHASLTEFYGVSKDLLQTARVAGHSSIKTTERYAKARDEQVQRTQKLVDKRLSEALGSIGLQDSATVTKRES